MTVTCCVRLSLIVSMKDQTGLGREIEGSVVWTHAKRMCGSDAHVEMFFESTEQVVPFVIFTSSEGRVFFSLPRDVCIRFKAFSPPFPPYTDDMPYFTEQKTGPECIIQNTNNLALR